MIRSALVGAFLLASYSSGNEIYERIKKKGHTGTWPTSWPSLSKTWTCTTASGMSGLGATPGSEDVEFSSTYNLAVVSVGFRHYMLSNYNSATSFHGLFVYPSDQSAPVKLAIAAPFNPQGISLFDMGNNVLRIFVVSHKTAAGAGKEEVVIVDYNTSTKTATSTKRVDMSSKYKSVTVTLLLIMDYSQLWSWESHMEFMWK